MPCSGGFKNLPQQVRMGEGEREGEDGREGGREGGRDGREGW